MITWSLLHPHIFTWCNLITGASFGHLGILSLFSPDDELVVTNLGSSVTVRMGKVTVLPLSVGASCGLVVSLDPREVCSSLRELPAWEAPLVTVPVVSVIRVVTLISGVVSGDLVSGITTVGFGKLGSGFRKPDCGFRKLGGAFRMADCGFREPGSGFRRPCGACSRASSGFRRQGGSFLTFHAYDIWLIVIADVIFPVRQ